MSVRYRHASRTEKKQKPTSTWRMSRNNNADLSGMLFFWLLLFIIFFLVLFCPCGRLMPCGFLSMFEMRGRSHGHTERFWLLFRQFWCFFSSSSHLERGWWIPRNRVTRRLLLFNLLEATSRSWVRVKLQHTRIVLILARVGVSPIRPQSKLFLAVNPSLYNKVRQLEFSNPTRMKYLKKKIFTFCISFSFRERKKKLKFC